jgi:hypothetical protein
MTPSPWGEGWGEGGIGLADQSVHRRTLYAFEEFSLNLTFSPRRRDRKLPHRQKIFAQ